jgi:hypothetical protein
MNLRFLPPLLVLWFPLFAAADPELPEPPPLSRYDELILQSPFAPATPVVQPVNAPSFATNFYVLGIAKIGQKDVVSISSKDQQTRFSLAPGETGPDGITVEAVQWDAEPSKSTVVLKKGTESGSIKFDEAMLQQTSSLPPQMNPSPLNPVKRPRIITPQNPGEQPNQPRPSVRIRKIQAPPQ